MKNKGKTCMADNCQKPSFAKGYCPRHYRQMRVFGVITNSGRSNRDKNEITIDGFVATMCLYNSNGVKIAETKFDSEYVGQVEKRKWCLNDNGYACTYLNGRLLSLHRFIFGNVHEIDHKNRDKLDNRMSNLRECTDRQNSCNHGPTKKNTVNLKGVHFCKRTKKWVSQITVNGKNTFLGRHKTKEEAALAYNEAAQKYHGEFAFLNNVPDSSQGQAQQ